MKNHSITIYSTDTCHYCNLAKQYFDKKGVTYTNKNVGADRNAAMEMMMKSGQMGVPVVEIDNQILVGFQPEAFDMLLSK